MKKIRSFILLIFIALLFTRCGEHKDGLTFKLSPEEALQKATNMDYFHPLYEVTDASLNTEEGFLLVDIRSAASYAEGHLPNAENIPVADLLERESLEKLKSSSKVVLYGDDLSETNGPWLLLTQLGLENVKVLEFGYRDIFETGSAFSPETAHYDFSAIFQKASERHAKELEAGKPKPVVVKKKTIVPKKKKKKEEEEGC